MGEAVYLTQELTTLTCWAREGCGIQFAIPSGFYKVCREQGCSFYCPRGPCLSIGESELSRLTKERDRAIKEKEWAELATKVAQEREGRARRAEKLAKGKLRNQSERVKNGVCPCCKRTFKQLAAHMASKHPGWTGPDECRRVHETTDAEGAVRHAELSRGTSTGHRSSRNKRR